MQPINFSVCPGIDLGENTTSCVSKAGDIVGIVVVLGFYVPPTAKVIRRRYLGLKSHPKDWRSPGSISGPLVYKAGSLTARPLRLLIVGIDICLLICQLNHGFRFSLKFWDNWSSGAC